MIALVLLYFSLALNVLFIWSIVHYKSMTTVLRGAVREWQITSDYRQECEADLVTRIERAIAVLEDDA